jgi:hypothetical protein
MKDINDQDIFMLCQSYGNLGEPINPAYFVGTAEQFRMLISMPFFNTLHGGMVLADPADFPLYRPMSLDKFQLDTIAPATDIVECF